MRVVNRRAQPDRCSIEVPETNDLCTYPPAVHMLLSLADPDDPEASITQHVCGAHAAWLRAAGVVILEHPWRLGGMACGVPGALWDTAANRCEAHDGTPDELWAELAQLLEREAVA